MNLLCPAAVGYGRASDITISLQSTGLSEWVTKYFSLAREATFWKKKKSKIKCKNVPCIFEEYFFFFFTPSWQVVDSFFLFNDRFPFWISETEFHRENYFDSARMRDVRREHRLAEFHWTVRDYIKSPKREFIFFFHPRIYYKIQFHLHNVKRKKNSKY